MYRISRIDIEIQVCSSLCCWQEETQTQLAPSWHHNGTELLFQCFCSDACETAMPWAPAFQKPPIHSTLSLPGAVYCGWYQCSLKSPHLPRSPAPQPAQSEWQCRTDPSPHRHGQNLGFLSCQACRESVTVLAKWLFPLAVKVSFHQKHRPSVRYSLESAGSSPSCKQQGIYTQPALLPGQLALKE